MEVEYPRSPGRMSTLGRERVRAHRCGSEGHDRAPGVCDYDGLLELAAWLTEAGCTHVAMEATGVYWNRCGTSSKIEESFTLVLANAAHPERSGPQERPERRGLRSPTCWRTG